MKKMTVFLDDDLHREMRHLGIDLGRTFQDITVEALRDWLSKQRITRRAKETKLQKEGSR